MDYNSFLHEFDTRLPKLPRDELDYIHHHIIMEIMKRDDKK